MKMSKPQGFRPTLAKSPKSTWLTRFAIVATITDFKRPRFSIYTEIDGYGDDKWSELYIDVDDQFEILYGNLIDVKELGR